MKVDLLQRAKFILENFIKFSALLLAYLFLCLPAQATGNIFGDSQNAFGVTPLMSSVYDQDVTGVRFFSRSEAAYINQKNIGGATALHLAARVGNLEVVKILVDGGAKLNIKDNEGWTPIMRAVVAGNVNVISYLLDNNVNASILNSSSQSVIYQSSSVSCADCLKELLGRYDFEKNMGIRTLSAQVTTSYEVARNKEDKKVQDILTNYLDLLKNGNVVPVKKTKTNKKYSFDKNIVVPVVKYKKEGKAKKAPAIPKAIIYKKRSLVGVKKFIIIKGVDKSIDIKVDDEIEKVIILNENNEIIKEVKAEDIKKKVEIKEKKMLFKFNKIEDNSGKLIEIKESKIKSKDKRTFSLEKVSEDKLPEVSTKIEKNIVEKKFVNDEVLVNEEDAYYEEKEEYYNDNNEDVKDEVEEFAPEDDKIIYHLKKEGDHFSLDVIEEDYDNTEYLEEDKDGDIDDDISSNENKRYYFIPSR